MRSIVSAPALRPAAHNLLSVANIIQPGDENWGLDGVNFTPRGCDVIFAHGEGCWGVRGDKSDHECPPLAVFPPYTLETGLTWHTADMPADPKARATETMELGTSAVLERLIEQAIVDTDDGDALEFTPAGTIASGGVVGRVGVGGDAGPKLSDGVSVGLTTPAAKAALAAIETKFVDASDHTGSAGTVYMKPLFIPFLRDALMYVDGAWYTAATGSRVVVGNFGDDTIYGHIGDVDVYLGDVQVNESVERATNEYFIQLERVAVVTWNTCAVYKQDVDTTGMLEA